MEPSLFKYIWRHTRLQQFWVLGIVLISLPFYFLSLDLPKRIVNGPIQGTGFETGDATQRFMEISTPAWFGFEPVQLFSGFEMERLSYLIALCLTFLGFVLINGGFKLYINTYKGKLGERMLRRLRYELVDRILRFPQGQFRRMKAPEVSSMVKDEVEPLGGFIGDAFVSPLFLGGQALTAMTFIMVQSLSLGLIALGIVIVQAFVIPRLRRRLLVLGKERQLTARQLAGRVGEIVEGAAEIHTNDTSNYERADIAHRLARIFFIRFEIYQRKFFVKFLNNLLAQITPFLFYLVGGYFAIRGQLDIGQLVAVIAAYKDLPSPIKELIDWDQIRMDVQIKYTQVVDQFAPDGMLDPALQAPVFDRVPPLTAPIIVDRLSVTDDTGAKLVENVSVQFQPRERVAIVGSVNAGGETVSEVLARLIPPTSGQIKIDGKDLATLPEAVSGRRTAYLGSDTYLPNTSIRDCLLYGLRHVPRDGGDESHLSPLERTEAYASGNTTFDITGDWNDYEAAGLSGQDELVPHLRDVLRLVELERDVYEYGLRGLIDAAAEPEITDRLLDARREFRKRLEGDPGLSRLVQPFDPDHYNDQARLAVNLLFGTAVDPKYAPEALSENLVVLDLLKEIGLVESLFDMGKRIAETIVELFGDLPPDHPFFSQLSFMTAEELPEFRQVLQRIGQMTHAEAPPELSGMLMRLPFAYIEPVHRLGLLDDTLKGRIVEARKTLRERLEAVDRKVVDFYEPDDYNSASSVEDNILFGRITQGIADGPARVREVVQSVLAGMQMRRTVFRVGLEFEVGSGGRRLTTSQRQKIALARALLKRPDYLIINRSLSALDAGSQRAIIDRILALAGGENGHPQFAVIWVLINPGFAKNFDRVLVFDAGNLVEDGIPQALVERGGLYKRLLS